MRSFLKEIFSSSKTCLHLLENVAVDYWTGAFSLLYSSADRQFFVWQVWDFSLKTTRIKTQLWFCVFIVPWNTHITHNNSARVSLLSHSPFCDFIFVYSVAGHNFSNSSWIIWGFILTFSRLPVKSCPSGCEKHELHYHIVQQLGEKKKKYFLYFTSKHEKRIITCTIYWIKDLTLLFPFSFVYQWDLVVWLAHLMATALN